MSSNSKLIAETQLGGHSDQTGALDIPAGTTAQRPSSPSAGYIRMNTTLNKMEMYNGSDWVGVGGSELRLYAVTPTTAAVANTSLSLTGEGFVNGATVHFVSAATGASTVAASVSFVSANKLTVTTPTLAVDGEPWSIKVTNPDGTIAVIESILDAGGTPTWSTAAGQLGSDTIQSSSFSATVAASDPDGTAIVYSESGTDVLTGSGSGKLGFTLNSSTGAIAGTMPSLSSDTTFNFTLGASDGTNLTTRNFNIVGSSGTQQVNYLYGGRITTDHSTQGTYGINGGIANGYYSHGAANYSNTTRTAGTSGYPGGQTGAGNPVGIHTQDGYEDGYYYFNCGGSGSTGVGITVGWYTGRIYMPADHDRIRFEIHADSFQSNQQTTAGDIVVGIKSGSISASGYGFGGSSFFERTESNYSDGQGHTLGDRVHEETVSSSQVTTINANPHYFVFYAQGGQHCNSYGYVYRIVSYNSAVGLQT